MVVTPLAPERIDHPSHHAMRLARVERRPAQRARSSPRLSMLRWIWSGDSSYETGLHPLARDLVLEDRLGDRDHGDAAALDQEPVLVGTVERPRYFTTRSRRVEIWSSSRWSSTTAPSDTYSAIESERGNVLNQIRFALFEGDEHAGLAVVDRAAHHELIPQSESRKHAHCRHGIASRNLPRRGKTLRQCRSSERHGACTSARPLTPMRTFRCTCGARAFFDNTTCLTCGRELGFVPGSGEMSALEPADDDKYRTLSGVFRKCRNYVALGVCNWMIPEGDSDELCRACRLNNVIPDLSDPKNRELWAEVEKAKRRLVYSLDRLGLPLTPKSEDAATGLAFDIKADEGTTRVLTGHAEGLITLNLGEADPVLREQMRTQMNERYRTLLGHFRHEVGHYYWEVLVRDTPALEELPRHLRRRARRLRRSPRAPLQKRPRSRLRGLLHLGLRRQPPLGGLGRDVRTFSAPDRHPRHRAPLWLCQRDSLEGRGSRWFRSAVRRMDRAHDRVERAEQEHGSARRVSVRDLAAREAEARARAGRSCPVPSRPRAQTLSRTAASGLSTRNVKLSTKNSSIRSASSRR